MPAQSIEDGEYTGVGCGHCGTFSEELSISKYSIYLEYIKYSARYAPIAADTLWQKEHLRSLTTSNALIAGRNLSPTVLHCQFLVHSQTKLEAQCRPRLKLQDPRTSAKISASKATASATLLSTVRTDRQCQLKSKLPWRNSSLVGECCTSRLDGRRSSSERSERWSTLLPFRRVESAIFK
jgi:hypothetical protein